MDLVDTDVIINAVQALQFGSDQGASEMQARCAAYIEGVKFDEADPGFAISTITLAELLAKLNPKQRDDLQSVVSRFIVLPFDAAAAARAGEISNPMQDARRYNGIPRDCVKADAMIAGTALAASATRIVTCDQSGFNRVKDRIQVVAPPPFAKQPKIEYSEGDQDQ